MKKEIKLYEPKTLVYAHGGEVSGLSARVSSKPKRPLSMLSVHSRFTLNPSETIWLVGPPPPLTVLSYFTSSASCQPAATANKAARWPGLHGRAATQKTKAQSVDAIHYWWTDAQGAACCAVNAEHGTQERSGVISGAVSAVTVKCLVSDEKRETFWCLPRGP